MKTTLLWCLAILATCLSVQYLRERSAHRALQGSYQSLLDRSTPTARAAGQPAGPQVVMLQPDQAPFHWSQIESTNYLAYITNLRSIGCPEETVRDIIVADVEKLFAPRYAALTANAPELAWWGRFDAHRPLRAELAARLRSLHEEKKALLERLLGPGADLSSALVEASVQLVRENNAYAFLPEAKQAAVRNLISRYETLKEWNRAQWQGFPREEQEARMQELMEARDRELAALLTPEEMREYELRFSDQADFLRTVYGQADLTEAEYRELYRQRTEFAQQHPEATVEDWKRLEAEMAATLGEDRFEDLQRQNDATWNALQDMATAGGVSNEAMEQAYAIKETYQEEMVAALGPFFDDPAQDPSTLRALAAEMEAELTAVLGPDAVSQLDRLGALPRLVVEDDGKRKMYSFSRGGESP